MTAIRPCNGASSRFGRGMVGLRTSGVRRFGNLHRLRYLRECPVPYLRRHFVAEPQAAYAARRELESLSDDLDAREWHLLTLLTTELVTNSVVHSHMPAQGLVRLDVNVTDSLIRVEVRDRGVGFEPHINNADDPLAG